MKRILFLIILVGYSVIWGARVDTVAIPSREMGKTYSAIVVVPEQYLDTEERFPVVYLLHGWSGGYRDWMRHTDLALLADRYGFILVCPEGGYDGWYVNSPILPEFQYETYISRTVVYYIDNHYRTVASRRGRFITGLSMGGHGALSLLCKHPELYAAAGSMSGVLELTPSTEKYGVGKLLGPYQQFPERWKHNSVLYLIERLQGKNCGIVFDCGVNDPFLESNRKVHQKMLESGIAHHYCERPGGHSWEYWVQDLPRHLLFFRQWFQQHSR